MIAEKCAECFGYGFILNDHEACLKMCDKCRGDGHVYYPDERDDSFSIDYDPRGNDGR